MCKIRNKLFIRFVLTDFNHQALFRSPYQDTLLHKMNMRYINLHLCTLGMKLPARLSALTFPKFFLDIREYTIRSPYNVQH